MEKRMCSLAFAPIVAMDDETLNLLIEAQVYGRVWTRYGTGEDLNGNRLYEGQHPDGRAIYTLSHDLAHTAHTDKAWALLLRYRLGLTPGVCDTWRLTTEAGELTVRAVTDAEVRRRICELALWQARAQEEEEPHGQP